VGAVRAVAAVVAHTLHAERRLAGTDPFSQRDGWQAYGVRTRAFTCVLGDDTLHAQLSYLHDGGLHLRVSSAGAALPTTAPSGGEVSGLLQFSAVGLAGDVVEVAQSGLWVSFDGQRTHSSLYWQGDVAHVFTPDGATRITWNDPLAHAGEVEMKGGRLTAPMPGKVVSFAVQVGDVVTAGQTLAVMEAMKMEHTIAAPADGKVLELLYAPGDQVAEGEELLRLQAA
jgi:3-methylcrotonyl-CoA carboxylase alpha subunit